MKGETKLITTRDIMTMMKVSRPTARQLGCDAGAMVRIGRAIRYDAAVLDAYLDRKRQEEQTATR